MANRKMACLEKILAKKELAFHFLLVVSADGNACTPGIAMRKTEESDGQERHSYICHMRLL